MHETHATTARDRILAAFATNPAPSLRELCVASGLRSISTVHQHLAVLVARGDLVACGQPSDARRYRLPDPPNALADAVRLMLDRTERIGAHGVVPWVAIEALRAELKDVGL